MNRLGTEPVGNRDALREEALAGQQIPKGCSSGAGEDAQFLSGQGCAYDRVARRDQVC